MAKIRLYTVITGDFTLFTEEKLNDVMAVIEKAEPGDIFRIKIFEMEEDEYNKLKKVT